MIYASFTIITMIIILALAAVGGSISERSGIINLSIEGFMTIGAIIYALMASNPSIISNRANQFWIIPIAGLATAGFATLYAFVTVKLKANQTIAGIALNILALAIAVYIIHSNLNPGGVQDKIQIQSALWTLGDGSRTNSLSLFNISIIIGIPVIVMVIILLNKTKFGIKLKTCGEQPDAATSLGMKVERIQFISVMIAGGISGMAGALFIQMQGSYFYGSTQGVGFLAVALVIFGQWRPSIILLGAIIFGGLYGMVSARELIPGLDNMDNPELLNTLPYLASLFVLIFTQRNSKAPKALGIPYENTGR
ncbi:ABC transporter permease [Mycoplasma marinum]|uniref:Sugar ABC transporter permease n=1 Tax=Mycoplasma marinum TaxID=1937190 RepID=A0A4R0XRC3_9MOLU|nr:ABC transporter permease [Mycoplasma marinum]TCG11425.1 hypothetical protein C4B24_02020 [Mycoplasma marinum]